MALPYEIFIGLRYLRAKRRQRTISLNTFVSIAGITLGVAALIGTLGIMTGFKESIQAKILGTTSHIIVQDRTKDGMASYGALVGQVETVPHVIAATPFVLRQVLLTSQSGVQGIVLRGIDPDKEVRVTELGNNIKAGRLLDLTASDRPARPTKRARNHDESRPKTAGDRASGYCHRQRIIASLRLVRRRHGQRGLSGRPRQRNRDGAKNSYLHSRRDL